MVRLVASRKVAIDSIDEVARVHTHNFRVEFCVCDRSLEVGHLLLALRLHIHKLAELGEHLVHDEHVLRAQVFLCKFRRNTLERRVQVLIVVLVDGGLVLDRRCIHLHFYN